MAVRTFRDYFRLLLPWLAAAYVGFYVFALVLGVFGPAEIPWMTAIAVLCALGVIAAMVAVRRGASPVSAGSLLERQEREQRETRGF